MAKSRGVLLSDINSCEENSSRCSCLKNGRKCSRSSCRCINCNNTSQEREHPQHVKFNKGCKCGISRKGKDDFVACQDGERKSKCPCLRNNWDCTSSCKCVNCGNSRPVQSSVFPEEKEKQERNRSVHTTYKRSKGVDFLANKGFQISCGPWTAFESIMLCVVVEVIGLTDIDCSAKTVADVYNFVAMSQIVREMRLPCGFKSFLKVTGKLKHMHAKHSVFESLLDSTDNVI